MSSRESFSPGPSLPPGSNSIRLRERLSQPVEPATRRRPPRRGHGQRPSGLLASVLVAVMALAGGAAYLYDHARRDLIAPGVQVGSVDIGGLRLAAARQRLRAELLAPLQREISVTAAGRRYHLSAREAHLQVAVDALTSQALQASRSGSILTRVTHDLDGHRVELRLAPRVSYSEAAVSRLVARVAKATHRPALDATVVPSSSGLQQRSGQNGRALDTSALRQRVEYALTDPGGSRSLATPTHALVPSVSTAGLASRYPAYIVVDRQNYRLRFYDHLRLAHTYPIAVGRQGLETPAGLYDVQWMEVNPSWHVPNSSWAGSLAGQTIPPGPADPIKARWMAFDGGAGIHGTDDTSSLGSAASHGCIRMGIPDVIQLYSRVKVGTPVYVA